MKFLKIAVVALSLGMAGTAAAHSDEYLETVNAPNGGQLKMAGPYHYELVVKPTGNTKEVLVYVTSHDGKEIDTKGAAGTATILSKTKAAVVLKPEGKNLMKGVGTFDLAPTMKAVVSISFPGQQAEQARFTPLAERHGGHQH